MNKTKTIKKLALLFLLLLVEISNSSAVETSLLPNSTGNYGFIGTFANDSLVYTAIRSRIMVQDTGFSATAISQANLAVLSDGLTTKITSAGFSNKDEYLNITYSFKNVSSINSFTYCVSVNTTGATTDKLIIGLMNWTNASGRQYTNVSAFPSGVGVNYYCQNISDSTSISSYVDLSGIYANISLMFWSSGDATSTISMLDSNMTIDYVPSVEILSYTPVSNPTTHYNEEQTFSLTLNQSVTTEWRMNGTLIQTNSSSSNPIFANITADIGYWNVTASSCNAVDCVSKTWYWRVLDPGAVAPTITSWGNSNTSDDSLSFTTFQYTNVTFNITSDQNIESCTWSGVYMLNCSGVTSFAFKNFTTSGLKTISVYVTNMNGTSSQKTWTVNVLNIFTGQVMGSEYAQFNIDLQKTGRFPYNLTIGQNGLNYTNWLYHQTIYDYFNVASVTDLIGSIYMGSSVGTDSEITVLNSNGTLRWKYPVSGNVGQNGGILDVYDNFYITSDDQHLRSFYPNGTLRWNYTSGRNGTTWYTPPMIYDDVLYIPESSGYTDGNPAQPGHTNFTAFDLDGNVLWKYAIGGNVYGSPALSLNDTLIFGEFGGDAGYNLYSINLNGTLAWKYNFSQKTGSDPVFNSVMIDTYDGTIYTTTWTQLHSLYAFYPNGTLKWTYDLGLGYGSQTPPALDLNRNIIVGSYRASPEEGRMYSVYPNGTLNWMYQGTKPYLGNIIVDKSGLIYTFEGVGVGLNVFYPENGSVKYNFKYDSLTTLFIGADRNGTVFFATESTDSFYSVGGDRIVPQSITNNQTNPGVNFINNTWTDSVSPNATYIMFKYANGTIIQNVSVGVLFLNISYPLDSIQNISTQVGSEYHLNETKIWFNDSTLPSESSISNLQNVTGLTWINWTWTDPTNADFDHVEVYLNGSFMQNVSKDIEYYNNSALLINTEYTISTRTVTTAGTISSIWVNQTSRTNNTITPPPQCCFTISGYINSSMENRVPSANISLNGSYAVTNTTGEFSFNNLSEGNYVVNITHLPYTNFSRTISIASNTTHNYTLSVGGDSMVLSGFESILMLISILLIIVRRDLRRKQ